MNHFWSPYSRVITSRRGMVLTNVGLPALGGGGGRSLITVSELSVVL